VGTRRPPTYRDPRKPPKGDRGGRDHGQPVVYRGHQVAGDYKTSWERYQAGLSIVGNLRRPATGGYQQPTERASLGYWEQGIVSLYCPDSSGGYGQILNWDAAPDRWTLELRGASAPVTAWQWTGEPTCSISGGELVPVVTSDYPDAGVVEIAFDVDAIASSWSFSESSGYGMTWLYARLLSLQPTTKFLVLEVKP
jgi:hypothetical protein